MAAGMNPIDLAGALQQYSAALQSGIGASNQALDAQMAALNTGGDGQRGALLQLAAGFLSPTRTGSFGESLGNAVGNYATADAQARQAQMDRALKLAQIQQARAKLMMEGAGSQFELAQTARKIQLEDQERQLRSLLYGGAQPVPGEDAQADPVGSYMLGQDAGFPPLSSSFQRVREGDPDGVMYRPENVTQINAVPQPLPEPAPAPMGRVLGTPPAPLDLPDQMLDPLTAPLMGPPASFGPSPAIPTSPQPPRRTPEADLPAAGANPAQARTGQTGFAIPGGNEQSLLSPSMTLSPEEEGKMRERAARMRGARDSAAPAATAAPRGVVQPSAGGIFDNAEREYQRLIELRRRNPAVARLPEYQELLKRQEDILLKSPGASGPTWGTVGQDPYGKPIYGWINAGRQTVTPVTGRDGYAAAERAFPPPPDGVDPVVWRRELTERYVQNTINSIDGLASPDREREASLRSEIRSLPSYKEYNASHTKYRSMVEAAERDTRISDLALVFDIAKLLDPGSVVREGEQEMIINTQSLPNQLVGAISALSEGGKLRPSIRKQILDEARSRIGQYEQAFLSDLDFYRQIAEGANARPEAVVPSLAPLPEYDPGEIIDLDGDPDAADAFVTYGGD